MTEGNAVATMQDKEVAQGDEANPEEIAKAQVRAARKARMTVDGGMSSIQIMQMFGTPLACETLSVAELGVALNDMVRQISEGDMSSVERLLVTQAVALNALFGECAHRASKNMGSHLPATDAYMRMALKAQQQSATTLKILGEIKNPRQVAFIKQQNNAQQQQVNNGTPPPSRTRKEEGDPTNELLEHQNGEWMDAGTAGEAGRGNQAMEAVGAVDRAGDVRG
ncbi:hypothetical protein [Burkholderia sp. Se-20378]|uniref:hypothetical protein n=1 Tax=Burkholderia sp. Se-20378 TaxID=2703899 RepID=UPI0019826CFE|nr:hypothetical protein [Burkholderia sp. Se-20378]MBN3771194.1 hypothetical protein [Burkholderia sp. Se-20378]